MKLRNLGALAGAIVLAASACNSGTATTAPSTVPSVVPSTGATATAPASPKGTLKIGVDLPQSGGEVANGVPTLNGIKLAVAQANAAGGVDGYTLDINNQDDALNGAHDPATGAANVVTLIADTAVIGMVGPFNSGVARAEIPKTNEAGLAQCSPANTGVDLTQEGSEVYRPSKPDVRNYFRVATPDNIQGPAGAQYAYNDLGKRKAYVVDDTEAFGVGVADAFSAEFIRLGGTVVKRDGNDYTVNKDFTALLTAAKAGGFDVVYTGSTQVTGGGQIRKDMGTLGMLDIPLVGPDGIADLGAGGAAGSFITLAGVENSKNVYGTVAGIHDIPDPAAFAAAYSAANNGDAPGAYSALAYACTQALIQSLKKALDAGTAMTGLREAVRANVFAGTQFDTVLGKINFDANGDSSQKYISFYKVDTTLNSGAGGWVFVKQQDFAATAP